MTYLARRITKLSKDGLKLIEKGNETDGCRRGDNKTTRLSEELQAIIEDIICTANKEQLEEINRFLEQPPKKRVLSGIVVNLYAALWCIAGVWGSAHVSNLSTTEIESNSSRNVISCKMAFLDET